MDGKAEAVEFIVNEPSAVTDTPLKDLPIRKNTLIAGIVRGRTPIIPGGNDVILPDDRVVVISSEHRLNDLTDILR
jgi:trk system potassium uptake protein TrkA